MPVLPVLAFAAAALLHEAPSEMALIAAGEFAMGCSTCKANDTRPVHTGAFTAFWMDVTPVTNTQFSRFVLDTKYKTIAERELDPKDYPGVPKEKLFPGSAVFTPPAASVTLENALVWWRYVPGASWRRSEKSSTWQVISLQRSLLHAIPRWFARQRRRG